MGYTPTNWKDGDLVTSEKLNKLEQGVANASTGTSSAGGVLIAQMDASGYLDKTWQEIYDADICIVKGLDLSALGGVSAPSGEMNLLLDIFQVDNSSPTYIAANTMFMMDNFGTFIASAPNDYPQMQSSN